MKTIRALVLVSGEAESPARGAAAICERFVAELEQHGLAGEVAVKLVDDLGWAGAQPLVIIYPEAVVYAPITPDLVQRLVEEHLCQGRPIEALRAPAEAVAERLPWLAARAGALPAEQRVLTRRVGRIDPESIDEFQQHDGYQALRKVLTELTPADVLAELERAGLRVGAGRASPPGAS